MQIISCQVNLFTQNQAVNIIENGSVVKTLYTTIEGIPDCVVGLAKDQGIDRIIIRNNPYADKIEKEVYSLAAQTYDISNLTVSIV